MKNVTKKMKLGRWGEEVACGFLKKKKFKILKRNYREKFGEIDIIARDRDRVLVFVEVKTVRYWEGGLSPEDQMTRKKMMNFRKMAEFYANKNEEIVDEDAGWRMDIVAILVKRDDFYPVRDRPAEVAKSRHSIAPGRSVSSGVEVKHYINI